ncbi:O-antigen ligase family protein [Rummeliibacillus pycnus]|uniref:O-antigen ligase family protein n=1 Tax=Rummeliibacillus pycnus TaxID=101070 RepID=UPI003D2AB7C4
MNLNNEIKLSSIISIAFLLVMISLYFGRFHFDIGFSLKPFMFVTLFIIIFLNKYMKFYKFYSFEIIMIIFIIAHSSTALYFKYPAASLRFILAFNLILIFYFSLRGLIDRLEVEKIEQLISRAGLIGIIASIIYYLIGISTVGMNFSGNGLNYYGLMIDRSTPRLTGTPSNDPNIFVFYITLYFFYILNHLHLKINKIGCFLAAITIILTFSRGASVAIVIGIILNLILERNVKKNYKSITVISLFLVLIISLGSSLAINPVTYIEKRFLSISSDGGSGRFTLWNNAYETFLEHPFGIGINSSLDYDRDHSLKVRYVHNSLLEVLMESGIIGITFYSLFWISIFILAIKLYLKNNKTLFILIIFITMFIQMLTLSIVYNEAFYFMLLILYRYSREIIPKKT